VHQSEHFKFLQKLSTFISNDKSLRLLIVHLVYNYFVQPYLYDSLLMSCFPSHYLKKQVTLPKRLYIYIDTYTIKYVVGSFKRLH